MVDSTLHEGSCVQARAAMCAQEQTNGRAFQALLFDETPRGHDAIVMRAAAAGLDARRLEACMTGEEGAVLLGVSITRAALAGVMAPPAVFLNGQLQAGLDAHDIGCLRLWGGGK
jgi:protein-disulfide isomerase